jgi:serine/threonine-protein kinase
MKPGEVIDGKYRVDAHLGEGGMGIVLEATHVQLGSRVAIKLLKPAALAAAEVPQRFLREARAAGRLRGEHIARVIDVGQLVGGEPYMVMEMLHGRDLATLSHKRRLPIAVAADYIVQACEGLAEAHALGMVHRDVKPANLFLAEQPNGAAIVKVLDFGIATAPDGDVDHGLTKSLSVMGSPSYMSPEQLRSSKLVDARSDIWSLGVTLYRLVSGVQPFVGDTFSALSIAVATEAHAPLKGVPAGFAATIDRCLAKRAEDRFPSVAALAAALAPMFPDGPVAAEHVARSLRRSLPPPNQVGPIEPATTEPPSELVAPTEPPSALLDSTIDPPGPNTVDELTPHASTTHNTSGESLARRPTRRGRVAWGIVGGLAAGALGTTLVMRATSPTAATVADAAIVAAASHDAASHDAPAPEVVELARPDAAPLDVPPPSLDHARTIQHDDPPLALAETAALLALEPDQPAVHALRAALLIAADRMPEALTELLAVRDRRDVDAATLAQLTAFANAHPRDAPARRVMVHFGLAKRRPRPETKAPCKPNDPKCGL